MENQLNNPEYRWYHPNEMAKIMPYASERNRLGVEVLDYNELREKNEGTIKERTNHTLNWITFKKLIDIITYNLPNSQKKEALQPKDRLHFEQRDKGVCLVCGSVYHYSSCNPYTYKETNYKLSHLHHVIPNGKISDDNIVTLCTHCHQMVHQAMFISGKWKFGRPL